MASTLPDAVVEKITSSLDLIPGMRATPQKLQSLLDHIEQRCEIIGGGTADAPKHGVALAVHGRKTTRQLHLVVKHPWVKSEEFYHVPDLFREQYPVTPDGLLQALDDAKTRIADHLKRGGCPDCEMAEPPRKRARALGMPKCCSCVLRTTLGI